MGGREPRRPTRHRDRIRSEAVASGARSATGESGRVGAGRIGEDAATPVSTATVSELPAATSGKENEGLIPDVPKVHIGGDHQQSRKRVGWVERLARPTSPHGGVVGLAKRSTHPT